jgi:hypothetical protein
MGLDTKTYWLTDRQSQCDFDFDSVESQPVKRVLRGWCEMAASLAALSWYFSSLREAAKHRVVAKVRLWKEDFACDIGCVIQWDCYSLCLKSIAKKRLVETVIYSGHKSVCVGVVPSGVCKWSINSFTNTYPVCSHTPLKRDNIVNISEIFTKY